MDDTAYTFPPDNISFSSSVLSLCPTAATLFFLPSVYTLHFLTALPGNMLSLWVFLRCISTISSTHIYLSHLSISNLMLCLTTPFLAAYFAWGSVWTLSGILCQLVLHGITPVLHINIYISLMMLTCVALSRFAALIQNTHASRPSAFKTLLPQSFFTSLRRSSFASRVCATVWVLAVGGIVPVTVYYSVNEALSANASAASRDREAEKGGRVEVCYNPTVEIGGKLSAALVVPVITLFFVFYLLLLLSYMTVLRHIGRSRRSTNVTTSQSLLGRTFRKIVVIQVVLSVCLLPYHIFKPIFISLAHDERQLTYSPGPNHCHPLSTLIELKNCLLLLAALRGSTDPLMYFLLDKTFRHETFRLLRCNHNKPSRQKCWSVRGSTSQKAAELGDGNVPTATVNISHESVL
ncbi:probable G-protein coupled receptor 82 [Dicentrarchus labrax]|uniref:G protein-coupled receptor 82 n=1 Tax=Dicentrarchus labrax TaxID=13489 RepID=A0A8C4H8T0_DICLA|nr:probable G-protein coupled receptor 82 [Dicentrarchus labrax]